MMLEHGVTPMPRTHDNSGGMAVGEDLLARRAVRTVGN